MLQMSSVREGGGGCSVVLVEDLLLVPLEIDIRDKLTDLSHAVLYIWNMWTDMWTAVCTLMSRMTGQQIKQCSRKTKQGRS